MWWLYPNSGGAPPEPPAPAKMVYIHGHCWFDPAHIVQVKTAETDQNEAHLFECKRCGVKEKSKPCDLPCDMAAFVPS